MTIATNMAGRGVDIKLGGDLAEEILAAINRVLRRSGNGQSLRHDQRRAAGACWRRCPPEKIGIYALRGGLLPQAHGGGDACASWGACTHRIGAARGAAHRQPAARPRGRQGDPGSSRFYLSMEDDLMRRFGGEQVSDLMQRLHIDDAVPLASGLVSRMIEQAQTRVEGANFDVRKHLLEYDDVLNKQRNKIYDQRDRIFEKEDLTEDIRVLLEREVHQRVTRSLAEDEGSWQLLAWLDEVQPPMLLAEGQIYPSDLLRLLATSLEGGAGTPEGGAGTPEGGAGTATETWLELAGRAMDLEGEHLLSAYEQQVKQITERAETLAKERRQAAETAIEAAEMEARETGNDLEPQALVTAVTSSSAIDTKHLPREHMQPSTLGELREDLLELVDQSVWARASGQITFWVQRRTGLPGDRLPTAEGDFDAVAQAARVELRNALGARRMRVQDEIRRELASAPRGPEDLTSRVRTLIQMTLATQTVFDTRTHQRRTVTSGRFTWVYLAASLLTGRPADEIESEVLEHLLGALGAMREDWGRQLWQRYAEEKMATLPADLREHVQRELREEEASGFELEPLLFREWPGPARQAAVRGLGDHALGQTHRELMLSMIGQLWVEYLTSMEALRTSIGLEAYAQRDPLVQYKSRAFDLYQQLMDQVRAGVVSRLFRLRLVQPAAGAGREALPAAGGDGAARVPGRNDPCWCGSGKKYKDCHWESDRTSAQAPREGAQAPGPASAVAIPAKNGPAVEAGPGAGSGKKRRRRH